jgi:hypothetical protein
VASKRQAETPIRLERRSLGTATICDMFEKPRRQQHCKLLIPRGRICRSEGSEYICISNDIDRYVTVGWNRGKSRARRPRSKEATDSDLRVGPSYAVPKIAL